MEKFNGWSDPDWMNYLGVNDDDDIPEYDDDIPEDDETFIFLL